MTRPVAAPPRGWAAVGVVVCALAALSCGPSGRAGGGAETLPPGRAAGPDERAPAAPSRPADPWAGRKDLILPKRVPPQPIEVPPVERLTLPNGLRVVVVPRRELPVVSVHLAVLAGIGDEPRDRQGIADLVAASLTRGTRKRSGDALAADLAQVGASLAASTDLEATHLQCSVTAKDAATCLSLLADVVTAPAFPAKAVKEVSAQLLAAVRGQHDDPAALAGAHFENALWTDEHPRGWHPTPRTVQSLGVKDVRAWHRTWFVPRNAVLAIAGDVDPAAVRSLVGRTFGRWRGRKVPARATAKPPGPRGRVVRLVDWPGLPEAHVVVGHLGVAHDDPDYLAATIVDHILAAPSAGSRLAVALRGLGGRAVVAGSVLDRWRTRGEWALRVVARPGDVGAALRTVVGELERLQRGGPTPGELLTSQTTLAGSFPARLETTADLATAALSVELHGLGEGYLAGYPARVAELTLEQARAAARERLDPANVVIVVVGDGRRIGPQLQRAGVQVERFARTEPISLRERDERRAAKDAPPDPRRTAEGRRILDAALKAKGGEARLRALRDVVATGKVRIRQGNEALDGTWTRTLVPPDRMRLDMRVAQLNTTLTVVVGRSGVWQRVGAQVRDLPPDAAAEARAALWRDKDLILLRHKEPGVVVQAVGRERIGAVAYDAVEIEKEDGSFATRLLIEPRSRLLFRLVYEEKGETAVEEFDRYRSVGGVAFAYEQRFQGGGAQKLEVALDEIKVNAGVRPETFVRPKP